MAVHNNMHITMQNKKLTCTTVVYKTYKTVSANDLQMQFLT